jgi:hypothetical protein
MKKKVIENRFEKSNFFLENKKPLMISARAHLLRQSSLRNNPYCDLLQRKNKK